jgi:hypothetical protein
MKTLSGQDKMTTEGGGQKTEGRRSTVDDRFKFFLPKKNNPTIILHARFYAGLFFFV